MAVREIRKWDDPVLKQPCKPVTVKELKKIKRDLEDTIRKTETGVGMAAPQIGISKCVVIVNVPKQGLMLFANPVVLDKSEKLDAYYEGCLSFPDHYVEIERPIAVFVEWMTRKGKTRREWIGGFAAKVLGHELDHLLGRCLVGDAWREGRTISGAELREMQKREEAKKKSPVSSMLGALAVSAMIPVGRACEKSTTLIERLSAQGLTPTGRKINNIPPTPEPFPSRTGRTVNSLPHGPLRKDLPEAEHASFERKIIERCSRTACNNVGSGYIHRDLARQHPGEYNNYCVRCARKINAVNDEEVILTPDQFQKVLFESEEVDTPDRSSGADSPGRSRRSPHGTQSDR